LTALVLADVNVCRSILNDKHNLLTDWRRAYWD